jgi:hypothetical protein
MREGASIINHGQQRSCLAMLAFRSDLITISRGNDVGTQFDNPNPAG